MIANPFINLIKFLFLHSTILVRTCDISCNASQCMRIAESRTHFRENVEHCIIASKSCVYIRTARIKTQASGRWMFLFRALLLRGCLLSQERCVRQLEGVGSDAYVHGFVIICRWRPWNPGHRVLDIHGRSMADDRGGDVFWLRSWQTKSPKSPQSWQRLVSWWCQG